MPPCASNLEHVGFVRVDVAHRRFDPRMSGELLKCPYVLGMPSGFRQEPMTECVEIGIRMAGLSWETLLANRCAMVSMHSRPWFTAFLIRANPPSSYDEKSATAMATLITAVRPFPFR